MSSALPCPCCGSRTLTEHAAYEICPVCFWEDDGTTALERPSAPNRRMCLLEARNAYVAWGAVDPQFVHHTRPPRLDEAPEGTPYRGQRPYERWPAVEVAPGVRFGWAGPTPSSGVGDRDGFLLLADGRRAGLRVHGDPHADRARIAPMDGPVRDREALLELHLPGLLTGTDVTVAALRAGLAGELVDLLPPAPADEGSWAPSRVRLGSSRTYADGGHGESVWEASPDDADGVARWAHDQLAADRQADDEWTELGPRAWVVRRSSPAGLSVRGVTVHDVVATPSPPGLPAPVPAGTRTLLEWSIGWFPPPAGPSAPRRRRRHAG